MRFHKTEKEKALLESIMSKNFQRKLEIKDWKTVKHQEWKAIPKDKPETLVVRKKIAIALLKYRKKWKNQILIEKRFLKHRFNTMWPDKDTALQWLKNS